MSTLKFLLPAGCFGAAVAATASLGELSTQPPATRTASVFAAGLQSPDGLARHPVSGEIFVSEETSGRISAWRNGRWEVVIADHSFVVEEDMPAWAVTSSRPLASWLVPRLRSPEGISFTAEGHLLVAEDSPNGRILEFRPDEQGRFPQARVIPVPWAQPGYAWEQVIAARDGRIFLSGASAEAGPGVFFGTVLMRDPAGEWWVVDYGPFASFTGLALSADEDVLVTAEEVGGAVSWWDTRRQEEIGHTEDVLPRVESVVVLSDGTILAAQESTTPMGAALAAGTEQSGRIVRIFPDSGAVEEIAAKAGPLESLLFDPSGGGRLLATEDGAGRVLEWAADWTWLPHDALTRAVHTREVRRGRGPKQWPEFLKGFVAELGIQPVEEDARLPMPLAPAPGAEAALRPMTLNQFAEKVPFVAGKVTVERPVGPVGKDPVEEVCFVLFYPNHSVRSPERSSPSLSLFAARHRSGRVERSRELTGYQAHRFTAGSTAALAAESSPAQVFLPLATGNVQPERDGTRVALSFLGADIVDDYLLALTVGDRDAGHLTLRGRKGVQEQYDITFVERDDEGRLRRNLVVAGMERFTAHNFGWYKLGGAMSPTLLTLSPTEVPFETRRTRDLAERIRQQHRERQLALGESLDDLPSLTRAAPKPVRVYTPELVIASAPGSSSPAPAAANRSKAPTPPGEVPPLRARQPDGEERVEPKPGQMRAEEPAPGQQRATTTAPPKPETLILSRAAEAWRRQHADN
jgi:hypothetical protein